MIEIRFKSDQKVRPFLRTTITLWSLSSEERLVCIFREGGRIQGERRACHNELGERVQQFRTGEHALLHARVEKVDMIAQQLVDRSDFQ